MIYRYFINNFSIVIAMNLFVIDFFDNHRKYVNLIEIFKYIFVKINYRFNRNTYFDIKMNSMFFQQICIIKHHLNIILYRVQNTRSIKSTILKIIKNIIQIRNIERRF